MTTLVTGLVVALGSLIGDAAETYDLTNIGTLFAFALVCAGVLVLRVKEPERPRPFRVPLVWLVAPLGIVACLFIMAGLPRQAWERFGIWLAIGAVDLCRVRLPAFAPSTDNTKARKHRSSRRRLLLLRSARADSSNS